MLRALYTAATGMNAQETNIDVISNNLANINTTAFKKSRAEFQDLMYQNLLDPGAQTSNTTKNPTGMQVGLGVETVSIGKVHTQGDLKNTGRDLDIAIEGEGMLQVTLPDGQFAYTRAGSLQVDDLGNLVTSEGYQVGSGITIPTDALSITFGQDGTITSRVSGTTTPTNVGQLQAFRFPNASGLRAIGMNLYQETQSSGVVQTGNFAQNGYGRINQGFLETSNVSVVEQVVNMITAQRAYEASSKGVRTAEDMLQQAINLKR
ncbi:MAG: flagellar basal-body rod protein FlgG [Bdellovibrionales bacterium]|nr:flagellar basal-body rod protein FlgG [Bdellovibrionales bacterium]